MPPMRPPIWTWPSHELHVGDRNGQVLRRPLGPHPSLPIPAHSRARGRARRGKLYPDRLAGLVWTIGLVVVVITALALLGALGAGLFLLARNVIESIWKS